MLGSVAGLPVVGESLLSLIPCLIKHRAGLVGSVGVGVAGWNTSAAWSEQLLVDAMFVVVAGGLGTLLGPEGTPAWCVLDGAIPGLAGLTRGFSVWWRWWVRGVVVC